MNYKVASVAVVTLALGCAAFILFSKPNELSFKDQQIGAIPLQEIKKVGSPVKIDEDRPSATQDVAKAIAQDLLERNPQGPQPSPTQPGVSTILALDPKLVASKILEEETKKIVEKILATPTDPKDIILSSSTSAKEYLSARGAIIAAGQQKLAPYSTKPFGDATLQAMASVTAEIIRQLKLLPVPEGLSAIHAEQIQLVTAQNTIFESILNRDADPIAASVSLSLIERVDKGLADLSDKIKTYISKNPS